MWNRTYSNRICNFRNKIREQNMHLERLFTIKPSIDTTQPYHPSFLKTHACKDQLEEDKRIVMDYENRILRGKLLEVALKPSEYNAIVLSPKHYPAFNKKKVIYKTLETNYDIYHSNIKLFERIAALKSSVDTRELLKSSKMANEYKERISNVKNCQNPYLKFETLEEFKRKIEIQLANELMLEETRPKTAQTTSKGNSGEKEKRRTSTNTKVVTQSTNQPMST